MIFVDFLLLGCLTAAADFGQADSPNFMLDTRDAFGIGVRAYDGTTTNKIACSFGLTSSLRIGKNGTFDHIVLVATNSPDASKFRVQTSSGTKALQKLP